MNYTEAQIEAAAKAIWNEEREAAEWDDLNEHGHKAYRDMARAALAAAEEAGDASEWTYFTQLDGDYAEESRTLSQAQQVRREARGYIPVEHRKIWRERTQYQDCPVEGSES